jgi:hypothetical protein
MDMKPPKLPQSAQQEPAGEAGTPAPTQEQAASKAEQDKRKEYVEYLEQHKDLTVDGE